ncbi:MAG: pyruvate, phosphate dikinase [Candidatus Aenigmatarchaeota archaeon]|nr:MAG: pyruvate, phosphate dikinase [Candidatus Aenigmarchaeota archaeon]
MDKLVYFFGEGDTKNKRLLGGKGANLGSMTKIGLPVPPGFTVTAEVCIDVNKTKKWPSGLLRQIENNVAKLERKMGKKFDDIDDPLLVSVRSGAAVSMPGMMDTVLNLGLNDQAVEGLSKQSGDARFAWDSYRRFIQMFGNVVMGVEHAEFEAELDAVKKGRQDTDLSVEDLRRVVDGYKKAIKKKTGKLFPQEPMEQLKMSVDAVFNSWDNKRARAYRRLNNIPDDLGTAVNVQTMVFGNLGLDSGTGVGFTRNPATGENKLYGEYLMNAQGEDVVAGIRTPKHFEDMKKEIPKSYRELQKIRGILEKSYRDMQDFEFTIEKGKMYVLQTRDGKRTAAAAVKIAVDMVSEGLLTEEKAIMKMKAEQLDQLLHKQIDPKAKEKEHAIAKGLPASPGAAVGKAVFTADEATRMKEKDPKTKLVLVRTETSPEDIEGMNAAEGILTARGGMTSHAAVVARGMGKCCVAGCESIIVDEKAGQFKVPSKKIIVKKGDIISLDGSAGEVFKGELPLIEPEIGGDFAALMKWVDKRKRLSVKTNADTPKDAEIARKFGAEGIGLCRTEHMFFKPERITAMREMILSETPEERKKALNKLLPMQRGDFKGLYKVMSGMPIVIRLLDPPLHEFLPHEDEEIHELAKDMKVPAAKIKETVESLKELNPMLGFRGCRLGVKYPEINEMQVRAIFEAAFEAKKEGAVPVPYIEVPLIGHVHEFTMIREIIEKVAAELKVKGRVKYKVGTMMEVPRAAITADEIAKEADFMSFGTNDLTQMACGFSRDDAGKFLVTYVDKGVYGRDPFESIDQTGVGKLMQYCVSGARKVKKNIEIGICGEHGGDPDSVKFCHKIGLDEVSCSPYRVPIARLAAAQAVIEENNK